jgi:hypothetical protein
MVFRQPENGLQGRDYTVSGCLGRGVCGSLKANPSGKKRLTKCQTVFQAAFAAMR